jgi:hypothetical protein
MKHKRELNPILYDVLWKSSVLILMIILGAFCMWAASLISAMGG